MNVFIARKNKVNKICNAMAALSFKKCSILIVLMEVIVMLFYAKSIILPYHRQQY